MDSAHISLKSNVPLTRKRKILIKQEDNEVKSQNYL
jgi:hypothetical protein